MIIRKIAIDIMTSANDNPEEEVIAYAAKMLKAGAVVAFPSDTSYGLAADPSNQDAMRRLYKIKGRDANIPVSCIFSDIDQIEDWAVVNPNQRKTLEKNLPGPFTLILEPRMTYPLGGQTIGVRIPDSSVSKAIARAFGLPFTATSANRSGLEPTYSLEEIQQQFEGQIYQPDVIMDAGKLVKLPSSAVIDIREKKPKIIRQGVARLR